MPYQSDTKQIWHDNNNNNSEAEAEVFKADAVEGKVVGVAEVEALAKDHLTPQLSSQIRYLPHMYRGRLNKPHMLL
jgi:hypothetical protein